MAVAAGKKIWYGFLLLFMLLEVVSPAHGIPAFARKYGLPCSACHQGWPMLNNFGQTFKDNGYQLGNDRDAPTFQDPAYWPIMFRVTPQWHRESTNRRAVDSVPGDGSSGQIEKTITRSGFDQSGIDIVAAGTLYKNISFFVQPFIGSGGGAFLSQMWLRFDRLGHTPWLNVKMGKFELDEPISQERSLTLSNTGGIYYNYFFTPPGSSNSFTLFNTPLGVELMGHSENDYTRYSVAVLSSNNGQPGLPTNQTYDVYANFTQGFEIPGLGLQKAGVFGYFGQAPTYFQTLKGRPIPGTGLGNRGFYRAGAYGLWYAGKFDFSTLYAHGQDNVYLGNATPSNQPGLLPPGAVGPSWNGGFVEAHYTYNPRLIVTGRYELVRMAREANPAIRANAGNLDSWTIGYRWYPIMSPRAGLAWTQEFSRILNAGAAPISGKDDISNSFLMGFDFDF